MDLRILSTRVLTQESKCLTWYRVRPPVHADVHSRSPPSPPPPPPFTSFVCGYVHRSVISGGVDKFDAAGCPTACGRCAPKPRLAANAILTMDESHTRLSRGNKTICLGVAALSFLQSTRGVWCVWCVLEPGRTRVGSVVLHAFRSSHYWSQVVSCVRRSIVSIHLLHTLPLAGQITPGWPIASLPILLSLLLKPSSLILKACHNRPKSRSSTRPARPRTSGLVWSGVSSILTGAVG